MRTTSKIKTNDLKIVKDHTQSLKELYTAYKYYFTALIRPLFKVKFHLNRPYFDENTDFLIAKHLFSSLLMIIREHKVHSHLQV